MNGETDEDLNPDKKLQRVLDMYGEVGIHLQGDIDIRMDESMLFAAYTQVTGKGHILCYSPHDEGGFLDMVIGHEISHMYLAEKKHPSHDMERVEEYIFDIYRELEMEPLDSAVLENFSEYLRDIYADDITFRVFPSSRLANLYTDMVKTEMDMLETSSDYHTPFPINMGFLLGNLERHGLGMETVESRIHGFKKYMSELPPGTNGEIARFGDIFRTLEEPESRGHYKLIFYSFMFNLYNYYINKK